MIPLKDLNQAKFWRKVKKYKSIGIYKVNTQNIGGINGRKVRIKKVS